MRSKEKMDAHPPDRVLRRGGWLLAAGLLLAGVLWLAKTSPRPDMSPGAALHVLVRELLAALAAGRGLLSGGALRQAVWSLIAAEIWSLVFLPLWAVAASWIWGAAAPF